MTRRSAHETRRRAQVPSRRGLLIALDSIDRVIGIIRASKDPAEAKTRLQDEPFRASAASPRSTRRIQVLLRSWAVSFT